MVKTKKLMALAAVGALTLAACGDDKEAATSTVAAMDPAAFAAAGDALCNEAGTAIESAFPNFEGEPTLEQVMKLGADLGPILKNFKDKVANLVPPADLADEQQNVLDAFSSAIKTLADMAASEAGAQTAIDAGGPPLDEPFGAAHVIFPACPASES